RQLSRPRRAWHEPGPRSCPDCAGGGPRRVHAGGRAHHRPLARTLVHWPSSPGYAGKTQDRRWRLAVPAVPAPPCRRRRHLVAPRERPGHGGLESPAMTARSFVPWLAPLAAGLRVSWLTVLLIAAINTGIAGILWIEDPRPFWHPLISAQCFGFAIAYCVNVASPWEKSRPLARLIA